MVNANDEQQDKLLQSMHGSLLESLRRREQEIFSYLLILVPTVGGFVWLLRSAPDRNLFISGTTGTLLLLFLGAAYSLALGYNYRYIILQIAKIEDLLSAKNSMLEGWPKSPEDFLQRYRLLTIPWCTPPAIIKVFWYAFLGGIMWVTAAACASQPAARKIILSIGLSFFIAGALLIPIRFGYKLRNLAKNELLMKKTP